MSIMGFVAIGFMTMIDDQHQSTNMLVARLSELEIIRDMTNHLSYPEACKNSITHKGKTAESHNIYPNSNRPHLRELFTIRDKSPSGGERVFYKNQTLNQIKLHSMQLVKSRGVSYIPNGKLSRGDHVVYLRMDFKRIKLPINSAFYSKTHFISLNIEVDNTGKAISCAASREKVVHIPSCPSGTYLVGINEGQEECQGVPCSSTTIKNCEISRANLNSSTGNCSQGYQGNCSYECTDSGWRENFNKCLIPSPSVRTPPPPPTGGSTSDRFTKSDWKYLGKDINMKLKNKNKINLFELHTEAVSIFQRQQRKIEKIKKKLKVYKNK